MEIFNYNLKDEVDTSFFMFDVLQKIEGDKKVIIACIGTDKNIGDSYGPLVGTLLNDVELDNIIVYGTLKDPIHALNVDKINEEISIKHKDDFIIAIDACLSKKEQIYNIKYRTSPVYPGKGMDKKLKPVGQASIVCCMGSSIFSDEFFMHSSNRLYDVYEMAKYTVSVIKDLDNKINEEKEYVKDEVSADIF